MLQKHGLGKSYQHDASLRLPERAHPVPSHRALLRVTLPSNVRIDIATNSKTRAPPVSIDQVVSDFDNVVFHVSTPETKAKILISIAVKCYRELVQYGAQEVLEREYGPYTVSPEAGYDFSVLIDLENLPADQGEHFGNEAMREQLMNYLTEAREDLINRVSLLKRNAMAAPFERAFDDFAHRQEEASKFTSESAPEGVREGGEVMAIHYRDEEAIYIKASHDRVTVIFSTIFREETDRVFGKVFLQEFVDARRRAIQNAPQVLFRNEPPLELQGVRGLADGTNGEVGYVTFGDADCPNMVRLQLTGSSSISQASHTSTEASDHLSYPDLPRLLPLSHQSLKSKDDPQSLYRSPS